MAESSYAQAQTRCGHKPLVFDYAKPAFFNFGGSTTTTLRIQMGAVTPKAGQKYYCTLHEAINDGFNATDVNNEAPGEAQQLYP